MPDDVSEALDTLGITEDDLYREADAEIEQQLDDVADEVEATWVEFSPEDTGEYKRDLKKSSLNDENGRPARRVGDYAKYAHDLEYGTKFMREFGIRAKVAVLFKNEGKYMI